jgi:hypothetical protein
LIVVPGRDLHEGAIHELSGHAGGIWPLKLPNRIMSLVCGGIKTCEKFLNVHLSGKKSPRWAVQDQHGNVVARADLLAPPHFREYDLVRSLVGNFRIDDTDLLGFDLAVS